MFDRVLNTPLIVADILHDYFACVFQQKINLLNKLTLPVVCYLANAKKIRGHPVNAYARFSEKITNLLPPDPSVKLFSFTYKLSLAKVENVQLS